MKGHPDLNDTLCANGVAGVRARTDAAQKYEGNGSSANLRRMSPLQFVVADEVLSEPVDFLWHGYLARKKFTLFAGDPATGKTLIAIDTTARITNGKHWPNGARAPIGSVIFLSAEDAINDTLRPRLEAAEADLTKVHILKGVSGDDGQRRTFSLQRDLSLLGEALKEIPNVSLICMDPLTSYMGMIESHRTTDVRAVLEPIGDFAEEHNVAVLAITHPPKATQAKALHAFTGSLAFVAAARLAFVVVEEAETDRRLLLAVKNNVGPLARGIGYRIGTKIVSNDIEAPCVLWDDAPVDVNANQALAAAAASLKDGSALDKAKEFVLEALKDGPILVEELEEAAEANGIKPRTLERAREKLEVKAEKDGFQGKWVCFLKGRQHAHN
jgi:hypothetical protein